jgi:hypothetical protein
MARNKKNSKQAQVLTKVGSAAMREDFLPLFVPFREKPYNVGPRHPPIDFSLVISCDFLSFHQPYIMILGAHGGGEISYPSPSCVGRNSTLWAT